MKIAYSHPDENLLDTATSVTLQTGVVVAGPGIDALTDRDLARPMKLVGTSMELRMAWAAPVKPAFPILFNSNFTVAATLEGRSDASWGSGAEVTAPFAIPTLAGDGLRSSPFLDLTLLTARTHWRLIVTTNGSPIVLGELWMGSTYRTLDTNYDLAGSEGGPEWDVISHMTSAGGELVYERRGRRETQAGTVVVDPTEYAALRAFLEACHGPVKPAPFVPRADVNDAWFVRLQTSKLRVRPYGPYGLAVELPVRQLGPSVGW